MRRFLADLAPGDVASALEVIAPGSGATIVQDADGALVIAWSRSNAVPDDATIRATIATLPARRQQREARIAARRTKLRTLAASAVGKDVTALSAAERLALLALVLEKLGVLDDDGVVLSPEVWS